MVEGGQAMSKPTWKPATENQRMALSTAIAKQQDAARIEDDLRVAVRTAHVLGVPILYLADALGVSRSRIRVLARETPNS